MLFRLLLCSLHFGLQQFVFYCNSLFESSITFSLPFSGFSCALLSLLIGVISVIFVCIIQLPPLLCVCVLNVVWMWRRVMWRTVSRHFVIIAEIRYIYMYIFVRLHCVALCSKNSASCRHKFWNMSFFCSSICYESFPCLLRGTEFRFLKCCHLLPSTYQMITLFVVAMNPYRNPTRYLHVSFCQYQSELLNGSLHVPCSDGLLWHGHVDSRFLCLLWTDV